MQVPTLKQGNVSRENVTSFGGYHAGARIAEGEFAAMKNCTGDQFPLIATRRKRGMYASPARCNGLLAKDSLCWVDGSKFVMNGYETELHLTDGPKQLVSMGAYVIIFPDKKYINTADLSDSGNLEAEFTSAGTVKFTPVDGDGKPLIPAYTQPEEPEKPENGALWLDTSGAGALLQWSAGTGMWVSVDNTLVRISCPNMGVSFRPGDGVQLTGVPAGVMTAGVIADCGRDYVTVPGLLEREASLDTSVTVGRYLPLMDMVLECGNRLWGCRYGLNRAGAVVNEIYASKLGDFRNWNCFQGVSTDSYCVSLGNDGPFTGAVQHLGYPVFFREDCIHRLYGSTPATFRLQTTPCPGVQQGCNQSLARVGQMLYYKSPNGVCAYDGAVPVTVSQKLGAMPCIRSSAGALGDKYYICFQEEENTGQLWVYDTARGLWHREDDTRVRCFCTCRDDLFFVNGAGQIISVMGRGQPEEEISWMLETGMLGTLTPDSKTLTRLNLRLELEQQAKVWVKYDGDDFWTPVATVYGSAGQCFNLPVAVRRCDRLRLRLAGTGFMRLSCITKTMERGSEVL